MPAFDVPPSRIRAPGDLAVREERPLVVYWMIGARRTAHNAALDRALAHARALEKPLVVLEPLRAGYRWASDRLHAFVVEGMRDNADAFAAANVAYHPYVEASHGAGRGLLRALAAHAAVVVTDEALGFFQPRMIDAAARALDVRLEVVDGNGLLPVRSVGKAMPTAYALRRLLQRTVLGHLEGAPSAVPLESARHARGGALPDDVAARWPASDLARLELAALPIDHEVAPSRVLHGGTLAAQKQLARFLDHGLPRYASERSDPDADAASSLSPWLHFGHLAAHEVFAAVAHAQGWTPARAGRRSDGAKDGFWGMDDNAEAFLDELVTWRELALNGAAYLDGFDTYDATPSWAQETLAVHERDVRAPLYSLDDLEHGRTHDDVWNASQRQLVETGAMHNALRMLWGKNVIAWSPSPREAFERLVHLNNKYAIDGRDPSSYAGIGWCFGRYDRPWPERAVFGAVRCMTTSSTRKKLVMRDYLARFTPTPRATSP